MKFTKRLLTIALSMSMVMPLCATAYAAPTVTDLSATIKANAEDTSLYDVTVTFTVADSSKQVTLLLTGPNTDNKLDDNDIVHINQFGKNEPDEASIIGSGTCTFSVSKTRMTNAGVTVDNDTGAIDGLWLSMNTNDAVDAAAAPSAPVTFVAAPEFILGDVNGDEVVDPQDGQRLYEHLTGLKPLAQGSKGLLAADVNKDESVDPQDGQRLYEHLTGLKPLK